jgi:hypothetical protein
MSVTAAPVSLRSPKIVPWPELGGDGIVHTVHDPALIPSHLLTNEQVKALQAETLRLRNKNQQRKRALRDLSFAMERRVGLLQRVRADNHDLITTNEDLFAKWMMARDRVR